MFPQLAKFVVEQVVDDGGRLVIRARTAAAPVPCPDCGELAARVHGYHLRRRRAEQPDVPVTRLLDEIRGLGYTGSANLLVRYLKQGRADAPRTPPAPAHLVDHEPARPATRPARSGGTPIGLSLRSGGSPGPCVLLLSLDEPTSTTMLAHRHAPAAGTVSEHLSVLRDAGFVAGERHRHEIRYRRTPLGEAVLR